MARSQREVAASLQVGVGVVTSVLRRAIHAGPTWARVRGLADDILEARLYGRASPGGRRPPRPDCAWIHTERTRPRATLELFHLEYLERHPDRYRYMRLCDPYRQWLARHRLATRQEHRAGEKVFVDYAGQKPYLIDPTTGELIAVELFAGVLGASNYTYARLLAQLARMGVLSLDDVAFQPLLQPAAAQQPPTRAKRTLTPKGGDT